MGKLNRWYEEKGVLGQVRWGATCRRVWQHGCRRASRHPLRPMPQTLCALRATMPIFRPNCSPPCTCQVIDVDTSSAVAEVKVSEAVVHRILLRYIDRQSGEVRRRRPRL